MMNSPFYDDMAIGKIGELRPARSILFYVSVMILAVAATGILVVFGLSALNRVEPISNTTVIFQHPKVPVTSNRTAKSSKDASSSAVQPLP
jgi:hypothetical protein